MEPGEHLGHPLFIPLNERFHRAVMTVTYPARQAQPSRLIFCVSAKKTPWTLPSTTTCTRLVVMVCVSLSYRRY